MAKPVPTPVARNTKVPIIIIKIRANKFKNILNAPQPVCTKFESITIKDPDGGHDVDKKNNVLVYASTTLRFRIECSDVTPNPYYPVGIAMNQIWPIIPSPFPPNPPPVDPEGDNIERLGLDVYDPVNRIAEIGKKHALVVGCKIWIPGKEHTFHIFIQDGRNGEIGIIDPSIRHEPRRK